MRIIDKQYDYYDYLQVRDDTLVFDRRDSYVVSKEYICRCILRETEDDFHTFFLLQCGAQYWLILATATEMGIPHAYSTIKEPIDYSLEIIAKWKNYDKPIDVLKFEQIDINSLWQYKLFDYDYKNHKRIMLEDNIRQHATDLMNAVIQGDYRVTDELDVEYVWLRDKHGRPTPNHERKKVYPILTACGIATIISADDMYNSIDEYFSLVKTASESTVAEGTTNNDKIVNHGFDVKASFRGKPS